MNKYLEKIASEGLVKQALNAQKAREMAKKVGVIADPDSNWKYALRNLRDGRGNPLEGQARREAINRLAGGRDVHREFQQMSAGQRKLREVDEMQKITKDGTKEPLFNGPSYGAAHLTEKGAYYDRLQKQISKSRDDFSTVEHLYGGLGNPNGLSISHVHPMINRNSPTLLKDLRLTRDRKADLAKHGIDGRTMEDDLENRIVGDIPNMGAIPSGGYEQKKAFRHMGKDERRRVFSDDPNLPTILGVLTQKPVSDAKKAGFGSRLLERIKSTFRLKDRVPVSNPIQDRINAENSFKKATFSNEFTHSQRAARIPAEGSDMAAFSSAYLGKVNPIYSPSTGVVGLHKTTASAHGSPILGGHRSIYLDMSPRKAQAPG